MDWIHLAHDRDPQMGSCEGSNEDLGFIERLSSSVLESITWFLRRTLSRAVGANTEKCHGFQLWVQVMQRTAHVSP